MRDSNERLVVVIVVALVLFALFVREARRGVRESGQSFTGVRAAGRPTLPSTAACVGETCALSWPKSLSALQSTPYQSRVSSMERGPHRHGGPVGIPERLDFSARTEPIRGYDTRCQQR